jgi:hypothetical protein
MMKYSIALLAIGLSSLNSVSAATFLLGNVSDVVAPTGRGGANTTYYGWETFNDVGFRNVPINDSTPDIGINPGGANFQTTNGQDHVLNSGNLYFFAGTLAEKLTAVTNGTVGTGFTTVIVQGVTASGFGGFPDAVTLAMNGVAPTQFVQGVNGASSGQFWAVWDWAGNLTNYDVTIAGVPNQAHYSFDRVTVDTFWSTSGFQGDFLAVPEPSRGVLLMLAGLVVCLRRVRSGSGRETLAA